MQHRFSDAELKAFDAEGRCVVTDHGAFVLFNVYGPAITNADTAEERFTFKLRFFEVRWLTAIRSPVLAMQQTKSNMHTWCTISAALLVLFSSNILRLHHRSTTCVPPCAEGSAPCQHMLGNKPELYERRCSIHAESALASGCCETTFMSSSAFVAVRITCHRTLMRTGHTSSLKGKARRRVVLDEPVNGVAGAGVPHAGAAVRRPPRHPAG